MAASTSASTARTKPWRPASWAASKAAFLSRILLGLLLVSGGASTTSSGVEAALLAAVLYLALVWAHRSSFAPLLRS